MVALNEEYLEKREIAQVERELQELAEIVNTRKGLSSIVSKLGIRIVKILWALLKLSKRKNTWLRDTNTWREIHNVLREAKSKLNDF